MLARTRTGVAAARATLHGPVVLVPTMGALHAGHRRLFARARKLARPGGSVLASIFVNPLQFGSGEDYHRYPRDLEADLRVCGQERVALVFAPDPAQMFPRPPLVTIDPGPAGRTLEGEFRPGFFAGVLTVVLKLFQLTAPQVAVFGEKDAQQLALVRRMTADLDLGVQIAAVPLFREPDGLAASSRNAYLSATERATALALPRCLEAGQEAAGSGPAAVLAAARKVLADAQAGDPPLALDYLELVDPETFTVVPEDFSGTALLLAAARVGAVRLVDNVAVRTGGRG